MQEIQLKANANKLLIILYATISLAAGSIVCLLFLAHDLSWLACFCLLLLILSNYVYLNYQFVPPFNRNQLLTVSGLNDDEWLLQLVDNRQVLGHIVASSIFTRYFALLQFKAHDKKKYGIVIRHSSDNREMYHRLARWWHSEGKR